MIKISPDVLAAIKRVSLPEVMAGYGLEMKSDGRERFMMRCPFHDDTTPSLSVSRRNGHWLWNCFGCRKCGDVINFVIQREGVKFDEACRKLLPRVNGNAPIEETLSPSVAPPAPPAAFLSRAVELYHGAFCESKTAQDYLTGRGIKDGALVRSFKVGFCDGRLRRMLPEDPGHEFAAALRSLGLLTERGGEFFQGCVTFPIFDENKAVVGMYGRRVMGEDLPHLYLPGGHKGVWNVAALKAHREIILTEKIIDALSLCELGFTNAVPLYGTNGLTPEHLRVMKEHRTLKAWLCLDNDSAGSLARRPTREKLEGLGIEVQDVFLPRGVKDINEALQKGLTADGFKVMMTPADRVGNGDSTPAGKNYPTVEEKDGSVFVAFPERKYRINGLRVRGGDQLRVTLRVESESGVHMDFLPLYSSSAREKFVACCRRIMKADAGELHRELNRLIEVLEAIRAEMGEEKEGEEPPMTPQEMEEALAALRRPSLLADVLRDMESMGYVGEEANKAVGYLVGISRKLDDPMSCVIMSQSSAGKSVLAETVEKMTPPEDVIMLSRLTANALYYMKRDALKHKLLILEERVGAESADYSIRSLQSKKKLTQAVPVKDERTGQIETKRFEVEGPIAYIETTTMPRIADDNATRCFELTLDESPEQTQRIHDAQRRAKTLDGLRERQERERVQRRHWNMQRLLKSVRIVIPYADKLDFPTSWLRTRRDHVRFLNLIEAVCFLHQHQRPVEKTEDGGDYIAATVEDYAAAYGLSGQVMGESLRELKKPQRELLKAIQEMGGGGNMPDGVTRREIREKVGLSDTRLRELLGGLVSLEYLRQTEGGGRGQTSRYRLVDLVEGDERRLTGLTTPETLAARLAPAARTSPVGRPSLAERPVLAGT